MLKRFLAALAVSLLAVVGFAAAPAQASTVYGCADNRLCIYRWTNFNTAGGHWDVSPLTINGATNQCIDLAYKVYPNDQSVADNSGSIIMNGVLAGYPNAYIDLYDWPNCNGANGNIVRVAVSYYDSIAHLSHVPAGDLPVHSWDAYHQIHSIRIYGY